LQSFLARLAAHDYPRPQIVCLRGWLKEKFGSQSEVTEQVYPSDEQIEALIYRECPEAARFDCYEFSQSTVTEIVKAALNQFAKSSPPPSISDETLKHLFTLAKTEAWEQFRVDARAVIEGAGK